MLTNILALILVVAFALGGTAWLSGTFKRRRQNEDMNEGMLQELQNMQRNQSFENEDVGGGDFGSENMTYADSGIDSAPDSSTSESGAEFETHESGQQTAEADPGKQTAPPTPPDSYSPPSSSSTSSSPPSSKPAAEKPVDEKPVDEKPSAEKSANEKRSEKPIAEKRSEKIENAPECPACSGVGADIKRGKLTPCFACSGKGVIY